MLALALVCGCFLNPFDGNDAQKAPIDHGGIQVNPNLVGRSTKKAQLNYYCQVDPDELHIGCVQDLWGNQEACALNLVWGNPEDRLAAAKRLCQRQKVEKGTGTFFNTLFF